MKKVIILGTGKKTKGGIASVLNIYESYSFWDAFSCLRIETHSDGGYFLKLKTFLKSYVKFIFVVKKYDVLHVHLSWWVSLLRKLPFILLAKILKKKVIVHVHASAEETFLKYHVLYDFTFRLANRIVYIYPSYIEKLSSKHKRKATLVYNPIEFPDYKGEVKKKDQIVFLGSLTQQKGIFDLLYAFSKVISNNKKWHLMIGGVGEDRNCNDLIKSLGITGNVTLLGWIEGQNKEKILNESKIFCLPSYTEGFPMSLIEAVSYKLVAVTSNVGGIPSFIKHKYNGLLHNPGDINQLAKNLSELINDQNYLNELLHNNQSSLDELIINSTENVLPNIYVN